MSNDGVNVLFNLVDIHHPAEQRRMGELRLHKKGVRVFHMYLRVLVPNSVYVVNKLPDLSEGWKTGQILVRNLDLTKRLKGKDASYDEQVFVRYDNLFDAYRAMSQINPRYSASEIPDMEAWLSDTNRLTELAWELKPHATEAGIAYELIAHTLTKKHAHVRNEHKSAAVKKTGQATQLKDVCGRFNAGRLPLVHLSIDTFVWKRIREARGIGHRMDFRAMVLELYIVKLMEAVIATQRDVKHLLRKEGLFYRMRTANELNRAAETLDASARSVRNLQFRPFSHVFTQSATDMREAADFMRKSALVRDPIHLQHAKLSLQRAYRSLGMFVFAWKIHEVLTTLASFTHRKQMPSVHQLIDMGFVVENAILNPIGEVDAFTKQPFEQDFRHPILDEVKMFVGKAAEALSRACLNLQTDAENDSKTIQKILKEAHDALKAAQAKF